MLQGSQDPGFILQLTSEEPVQTTDPNPVMLIYYLLLKVSYITAPEADRPAKPA